MLQLLLHWSETVVLLGSSDTWVPSHSCSSCGNHRSFNRPASATFQELEEKFEGLYGSGDSYGTIGADVVALGNYSAPEYAFAVITEETGDIPVRCSSEMARVLLLYLALD